MFSFRINDGNSIFNIIFFIMMMFYRIRNDDIRDKFGVAPIQDKLVQHYLR
jgi:hypothetical protein